MLTWQSLVLNLRWTHYKFYQPTKITQWHLQVRKRIKENKERIKENSKGSIEILRQRKNSTKPNYHLLWWMIYATTRKSGLYKNPQKLGDSFSLFLFSTKPTESSRKNSRFHFFFFFCSITHFFSFSKHNFFFSLSLYQKYTYIYIYVYICVFVLYIYTQILSLSLYILLSLLKKIHSRERRTERYNYKRDIRKRK